MVRRSCDVYNNLRMSMENSEEFIPDVYSVESEEHYGAPKKQQKYVSGPKNGVWSDLQHTQYIVFMEYHKSQMRSKEKRRSNKLFKNMAEYIGTRNALQCRSHHQKLEEKHLYPNKIISHFKQHNQTALYTELKQELEAKQGPPEQMAPQNLKRQKKVEETATQSLMIPVPEVRENLDLSACTSPKSNEQLTVGCGFNSYTMNSFFQPNGFNLYPYMLNPMFSFF